MREAQAEDELELYIVNDGDLYREHRRPLEQRLILAKLAGTYDRLRALKGYDALVREGVRRYAREFPGSSFSPSEKKDAASSMLGTFEVEYKLGNMKPDGPKGGASTAQLNRDIAESLAKKRKR